MIPRAPKEKFETVHAQQFCRPCLHSPLCAFRILSSSPTPKGCFDHATAAAGGHPTLKLVSHELWKPCHREAPYESTEVSFACTCPTKVAVKSLVINQEGQFLIWAKIDSSHDRLQTSGNPVWKPRTTKLHCPHIIPQKQPRLLKNAVPLSPVNLHLVSGHIRCTAASCHNP